VYAAPSSAADLLANVSSVQDGASFSQLHPSYASFRRYEDVVAEVVDLCETQALHRFRLRFCCEPLVLLFLWHVAPGDRAGVRAAVANWLSPLVTNVASRPEHCMPTGTVRSHARMQFYRIELRGSLRVPIWGFKQQAQLRCGTFQFSGFMGLSQVRT
jgi:hypothetical protein